MSGGLSVGANGIATPSEARQRAMAIVRDIETAPSGQRRALVLALVDSAIGEQVETGTKALQRLSVRSNVAGANALNASRAVECGQAISSWIEVCHVLCDDDSVPHDIQQQAELTRVRCIEFTSALANALSALDLR